MEFSVGDFVGVPAKYAQGAFDDELMVSIEYEEQSISGFVRMENIKILDKNDGKALVKAKVLNIDGEIVLKILGSFFTTNGIEPFQADWANKNLNREFATM